MKNNKQILFRIVVLTILVKLILLPFSQVVDADAVSRIYLSLEWLNHPRWITTDIWGPFHYYLNGIFLSLWNNPVYTPAVVNILFSSLTLIPFYHFTRREFNNNGALIATIFLAISPILFRNSFLALSETPYLFFLVLTMNLLSKGLRGNLAFNIFLAGFALTIAAGFRYEAWLMIFIFTLVLLLFSKRKYIILFVCTALVFPTAWMISNYAETGDAFYSIQGNYHWTLEMLGNNDKIDFESYLRRIWYFPLSWMIALGPLTAFIVITNIFKTFRQYPETKSYIIWSIPFWIMFFVFEYNAFKGVLLLQHRFIGTLVVLSLPFGASYFEALTPRKIKTAILFCFITVALTFVYNTSGVKPLPRLQDQSGEVIAKLVKHNVEAKSCLILDFIGWENTYYIALKSGLPKQNIIITGGAKNSGIPVTETENMIKTYKNGIVLLKKDSPLYHHLISDRENIFSNFDAKQFNGKTLFEDDKIFVFKWDKI